METKKITVNIPAGYVIDEKASNFESGDLVLKPSGYSTCANKLFGSGNVYAIRSDGLVVNVVKYSDVANPLLGVSPGQLKSILDINRLVNVAKLLNGGWVPRTRGSKFCFNVSYKKGERVLDVKEHSTIRQSVVYFKSRELAFQALQILGEPAILNTLYMSESSSTKKLRDGNNTD